MPSLFEDEYCDILGKARRGRSLGVERAAQLSGMETAAVVRLEAGRGVPEENSLRALAQTLSLSPAKMSEFAFRPAPPASPPRSGFFLRPAIKTRHSANTYLLICQESHECAVIDPGADAAAIMSSIERASLSPVAIFLTHSHSDHTAALAPLQDMASIPAFCLEPVASPGSTSLARNGDQFSVGRLKALFIRIPGHTPGSALIRADRASIAFTGDSLFARSTGGAAVTGTDYQAYLDAVRKEILGLPSATLLCPGHGPLTNVADELRLNPFFP